VRRYFLLLMAGYRHRERGRALLTKPDGREEDKEGGQCGGRSRGATSGCFPVGSSPLTIHQIADLAKENLGAITLTPNESNIFQWKATLPGPAGSPYEGGVFEVDIRIPEDYPWVLLHPRSESGLAPFLMTSLGSPAQRTTLAGSTGLGLSSLREWAVRNCARDSGRGLTRRFQRRFSPPHLHFVTKLYHCNVASTGAICTWLPFPPTIVSPLPPLHLSPMSLLTPRWPSC
jgi:hypothetical protein